MNQLHANIDLYSNAPLMYWFESKQYVSECYMQVWSHGREFIGYLQMPDDRQIQHFDLRYVGLGDIHWIEEYPQRKHAL